VEEAGEDNVQATPSKRPKTQESHQELPAEGDSGLLDITVNAISGTVSGIIQYIGNSFSGSTNDAEPQGETMVES
jgi:hypothetical protein